MQAPSEHRQKRVDAGTSQITNLRLDISSKYVEFFCSFTIYDANTWGEIRYVRKKFVQDDPWNSLIRHIYLRDLSVKFWLIIPFPFNLASSVDMDVWLIVVKLDSAWANFFLYFAFSSRSDFPFIFNSSIMDTAKVILFFEEFQEKVEFLHTTALLSNDLRRITINGANLPYSVRIKCRQCPGFLSYSIRAGN